jgi:lysophospholipase L1-like esterase
MRNTFPVALACWLFVVSPGTVRAQPPAGGAAQAPAATADRWEADIRKFEDSDKQNRPADGGIVFTGASSIRRWTTLTDDFAGYPVINRGFGGSQYSDLIQYADRIIIPYKPKLVVLYSGDNDINRGKTPEQVAADFKTLVGLIHKQLPETRVAFISIKPSLSRWKMVGEMRAANDLAKSYIATDKRLVYIDVFTPMLGPDGKPRSELLVEDGLHPSAQGYALWKSVIEPYLGPKRP